jgi:hypothetical protein
MPQRLNTQTKTIPSLLCSAASASKARTAVTRSPYAAGRAKAAGKSGETTPGTKNAKPMNRKLCKRSSGRRARARGWMHSAGQRYRAAMIPPGNEAEGDTGSEQGLRRHHGLLARCSFRPILESSSSRRRTGRPTLEPAPVGGCEPKFLVWLAIKQAPR